METTQSPSIKSWLNDGAATQQNTITIKKKKKGKRTEALCDQFYLSLGKGQTKYQKLRTN